MFWRTEQKEFLGLAHHLFRNSSTARGLLREAFRELEQDTELESGILPVSTDSLICRNTMSVWRSHRNEINKRTVTMGRCGGGWRCSSRLQRGEQDMGQRRKHVARLPPLRGALEPAVALSLLRIRDQGLICHQHEHYQRGLSRPSSK